MKLLSIALISLPFLFLSCGNQKENSTNATSDQTTNNKQEINMASNALTGSWQVKSIMNKDIVNVERAPHLTFDLKKKSINGKDGCNTFFGSILKASKDSLRFGPIATTMMYCEGFMDIANQFGKAIEATKSYRFTDTFLIFLDSNQNEVIRFTKKEE